MKRTPLRKKAKSHTEGWWRGHADDLMQDCERKLYLKCLVCGGPNQVGHHYQTKQTSSFLRYDWRNIIPLCFSCHFKHHKQADPYIAATIIRVKGQAWAEEIERDRRKSIKTGSLYYQEKCREFEEQLKDLT
jgi:hypothetical protein